MMSGPREPLILSFLLVPTTVANLPAHFGGWTAMPTALMVSVSPTLNLPEWTTSGEPTSEQLAARTRGAQREEEDDQRRHGHDPGLAADDRERDQALAFAG